MRSTAICGRSKFRAKFFCISKPSSLLPNAVDSVTFERGHEIARLNGQPLLALQRLAVVGGNFVARASIPRNHVRAA
jgi:hypothetical protein